MLNRRRFDAHDLRVEIGAALDLHRLSRLVVADNLPAACASCARTDLGLVDQVGATFDVVADLRA